MDILVYKKDNLVVEAGQITRSDDLVVWNIIKPDGTKSMRLGDIFEKYEVKEIPEDYEDYKYYYEDGMFKLNVVYYHNETNKRIKDLENENKYLSDTLDDILTNIIPSLVSESDNTNDESEVI